MNVRLLKIALTALLGVLIAGCAKIELAPHLVPLSKETMMLLGKKGMTTATPMYVRIFKEESELELWKQRDDGRFYHFKTYPICNWSGALGPKTKQGDMQAPEGFYRVPQHQMNPNSQYHLAFNLGFPNAYDRANNRSGDFLMIHGKCKSAGCYAMTDALIEEIYALARESFIGGQEMIHVDAFPFRMTQANLERQKASPHHKFWLTMKDGYDFFEADKRPATVTVCERRYVVNASFGNRAKPRPDGACPPLDKVAPETFTPLPAQAASAVVVEQGPKTRTAVQDNGNGLSGGSIGASALGFAR